MTNPIASPRISAAEFEKGFTGNGKVFIHVEKHDGNSEKLVIYEANNAVTAFFLNLFRNPSKTYTAREWAATVQGKAADKIDKQQLIQNIKFAASKAYAESAPEFFNQLIQSKKLDAPEAEVSDRFSESLLAKAAFAAAINATLATLTTMYPNLWTDDNIFNQIKADLQLDMKASDLHAMVLNVHLNKSDSEGADATDPDLIANLLSLLDTRQSFPNSDKNSVQDFVKLLIAIESKSQADDPSHTNARYLSTLNHINTTFTSSASAPETPIAQT